MIQTEIHCNKIEHMVIKVILDKVEIISHRKTSTAILKVYSLTDLNLKSCSI